MADPGKGAGGADAPLFLDQTEQPRPQGAFPWLWGRGAHMAEKNLLATGTPSPLIPALDDPPPPLPLSESLDPPLPPGWKSCALT